jgi:hypothetical protein
MSRSCFDFIEPSISRRTLMIWLLISGGTSVSRVSRASVGFRVIVNEGNPVMSASDELLTDLFLKRRIEWPSGISARPVDLKADSPARKEFSKTVLHRSVEAVKSYWQQVIFAGRGVPPPEVDSDMAVVAHVIRHPGAVGYVTADTKLDGVKTIAVQ